MPFRPCNDVFLSCGTVQEDVETAPALREYSLMLDKIDCYQGGASLKIQLYYDGELLPVQFGRFSVEWTDKEHQSLGFTDVLECWNGGYVKVVVTDLNNGDEASLEYQGPENQEKCP